METKRRSGGAGWPARVFGWLKREKWALLVLLLAAAILCGVRLYLRGGADDAGGTLRAVSADLTAGTALPEGAAVLTVEEDRGIYAFYSDTKYLTCGETEEALFFADSRTGAAEWNVVPLGNGGFALLSDALRSDGAPLGVSCIGGFTVYAYREGAAAFQMEFWAVDAASGTVQRMDRAPADGETVLLYFPQKTAVLSLQDETGAAAGDFAEYEKGTVLAVTEDTAVPDEAADGAYRGRQTLTVQVRTGRYQGRTLTDVYHYVGPLNSVPVKEGDGVSLILSTYADGSLRATVYEYNRIPALAIVLALFCLVTALVGGKTGVKSLVGLAATVTVLFLALIPLLLRGFPTLPTVFAAAALIAVISFTVLGGVHRKTVCAMLGAVAGTGIALGFGLLAQTLARVDGLRISDVEPLLQLRQTGTPIGLKGLLVGGIVISALGAVMDVAMSVSSALEEVHAANPALGRKALFRSGMNMGRDMVGTMTNTLILAFLGAGFTLIIYLYSLGLQPYQLLPSAYAAVEVISGVAASVGMILSIPLTALISAFMLARKQQSEVSSQ